MLDASFQSSYRNETTPRGTHLSEIYRSTSQNYNAREGNDDDVPLSGIIPLSKLPIYLQYLQLLQDHVLFNRFLLHKEECVFTPEAALLFGKHQEIETPGPAQRRCPPFTGFR